MSQLSLTRRFWSSTLFPVLLMAYPSLAPAQSEVACGAAATQLQAYIQQVNSVAQFEYNRGIPARCGYNGYCAQSLLQQLSIWYSQQSMLVNQWYDTIARQCSTPSERGRASSRKRQADPTEEIADADDLKVDDEDKTVKIRIPSKPSGFSGGQR